jgi:hypothetical protein
MLLIRFARKEVKSPQEKHAHINYLAFTRRASHVLASEEPFQDQFLARALANEKAI